MRRLKNILIRIVNYVLDIIQSVSKYSTTSKTDKLSALVEVLFYGGRKTMRKQRKNVRKCE